MDMELELENAGLLRQDEFQSPHPLHHKCALSSKAKKRIKVVCYLVCAISALCALVVLLPVKEAIVVVSKWVGHHHGWGSILLPLMFCIAIPLAIPATMLEILSGSAFGVVYGVVLNVIGKTLGALTAFMIGKRLGKERIGSYLQTNFPLFTAMSAVVEGPNWKPLVLIQLSNIPPVVKCYGLAITDVSMLRFVVTAFIGGIPNAILWSYIGYQTNDLVSDSQSSANPNETNGGAGGSQWIMIGVGLTCTVLAMGVLFVYTRRELNAQLLNVKKRHVESDCSTSEEDEPLIDSCVIVTQVALRDEPQVAKHRVSIV